LFGDASRGEAALIHSIECRQIGSWCGLEPPTELSQRI
jgi:hypothetical protein